MKAKILFLDDDKTIREVLTEYMRTAGYTVVNAKDGKEALDLLYNESFDLIILDIMVPYITGLDILKQLPNNNKNAGTIMLTALDDEGTQISAFNCYADDYIIKPVSPLILLKRIEAILRRSQINKTKKRQEYGKGLFMDIESYRAYYNNMDLKLTVNEFLILNLLFQNPNHVLTREQLILQTYNEDYIGNDRIIDSHIKNIRKKLPHNLIRTVIGVGYAYDVKNENPAE